MGSRNSRGHARILRQVPCLWVFGVIVTLPGEACVPHGPVILSAYRSEVGANQRPRRGVHAGVDFAGAMGDPILASADGEVLHLTVDPVGCGLGILLAHWDFHLFTVYCHLESWTVSEGQLVRRGEAIGRLGRSGNSGGVPHVHLELCTHRCRRGHRDGFLLGSEDPMARMAGCFRKGRSYPTDRLVLTYPVRCSD